MKQEINEDDYMEQSDIDEQQEQVRNEPYGEGTRE